MAAGRVRIEVLGRTTLSAGPGGTPLSPTQRCLLATLVLAGRTGVTPEQLVDAVWGDAPPRSARNSLHNQLARLRRQLPPDSLAWDGRRYRLVTDRVDVDVHGFVRACATAGVAAEGGDVATVLRRTEEALSLWRGEPYEDVDVDAVGDLELERIRLGELRAEAEDAHARALLATGQLPAAIARLQELVRAAPHREGRWVELMRALSRAGRRADALATYESARRYFVGELGLEPPPGLAQLQVDILRQDTAPTDAAALHPRPIVGRDEVVADLDAALADTPVVVLTGEAGVGKSTVAQALVARRRRRGELTVAVTCASNPWSALQPVVDLLAALHEELAALVPPAGPSAWQLAGGGRIAAATSPLGSDPGVLHEEVADALGRIAEAAGGLTLVLDDAHRGGPTTHRLLRAAIERSDAIRLVVAVRQRSDLPRGAADDGLEIGLTPLDRDAIAALVGPSFDRDVDTSALLDWLQSLTGGNALFVTALLEDLARRGVLSADGTARPPRTIEVPPRLHDAIAAAIGVLGLQTRRALDVVAVLDEPVDDRAVAELTDPAHLEPAVTAGILRRLSPTTTVFRHELMRRVAYDLVPTGRRVELHHEVATIGREVGMAAPQVAAHALAAAALDPAGAVAAARRAGEVARDALAYEEAADWFDRAAEVARDRPVAGDGDGDDVDLDLLSLEVEAADALRLAGVPGHADRLLDAAERAVACDDAELRTRAVLAALRLGETGEPGPLQRRAADLAAGALAREPDPTARAAISASASLVHSLSGAPERCRELFADALDLLTDDDPVTAVQVLPYAYMGLAHADDLDRRAAAADRLLHDAELLDDPIGRWEGLHLRFTVALQHGDGARLRATHAEMERLRDRVGDAGRRWSVAYQQAALAHLDGDLEAAEAAAEHALRIGVGVAASRAFSAYAGQLLELRRQGGRLAELVPVLEQLLERPDPLPAWTAAASMVLAETDPVRSARLFEDLVRDDGSTDLPYDFSWLASMLVLARGAVMRRDRAHAELAGAALLAHRDRVSWQGTCSYGPVALVLAEVAALTDRAGAGDLDASTLATQAATIAHRLQAPRYLAEADALTRT